MSKKKVITYLLMTLLLISFSSIGFANKSSEQEKGSSSGSSVLAVKSKHFLDKDKDSQMANIKAIRRSGEPVIRNVRKHPVAVVDHRSDITNSNQGSMGHGYGGRSFKESRLSTESALSAVATAHGRVRFINDTAQNGLTLVSDAEIYDVNDIVKSISFTATKDVSTDDIVSEAVVHHHRQYLVGTEKHGHSAVFAQVDATMEYNISSGIRVRRNLHFNDTLTSSTAALEQVAGYEIEQILDIPLHAIEVLSLLQGDLTDSERLLQMRKLMPNLGLSPEIIIKSPDGRIQVCDGPRQVVEQLLGSSDDSCHSCVEQCILDGNLGISETILLCLAKYLPSSVRDSLRWLHHRCGVLSLCRVCLACCCPLRTSKFGRKLG